MKNLGLLLFALILLTSCKSPTDAIVADPILKVTNMACGAIISVSLVGYDFQDLTIGSYAFDPTLNTRNKPFKAFELTNGIAGGLTDVNVSVISSAGFGSFFGEVTVDFVAGDTTAIKLVQTSDQFGSCNYDYFEVLLDE
tara:strand:- start:358 stop:777 length:420 start_codon:yes stop_codon:yes gene_type:complete